MDHVVREVRRVTYAGMFVNLALATAKGIAGVVWHSQALVADAIHSLSDLVTDVAVLVGVKYWSAPPDSEHPYGHGKIEALVSLFIAGALSVVAGELAVKAITSLTSGQAPSPSILALVIALVSIAVKEWLFRWTRRVARRLHSTALEANAWHHRSDAISSVPVAISLVLACFFPSLGFVDAIGGLIVSCFILKAAWDITRPSLQELVDAGIDDKSAEVERVARAQPGILDVHCCRARRYGGAFQADLHVQVEASLSVAEAHTLGHDVKNAILRAGIDVTDAVIHVEPRDVQAVVALGSNIEPRADYLAKALAALSALPCTHFIRASQPVETEPVDVPEEFAEQKFLNQVAVFETALEPHDFSRRMHEIEDRLGRVRTVRNGPRTIDIDLIDFGGLALDEPELTLPHPRAARRDFVLRPLDELGLKIKGVSN